MRHAAVLTDFDPRGGEAVTTLAYDYPAGYTVPSHAHGSDQLIYAPRGVMEVAAGPEHWLIPPQFAIWIPALTVHRIRMPGAVAMRTLYLRRGLAKRMPRKCVVVHVAPLLRELLLETVRIGRLAAGRGAPATARALLALVVARIEEARTVPVSLIFPSDRRARKVARAALTRGGSTRTLHELSLAAGASVRTVERAFQQDVGSSFEAWRRQARLLNAIELLVRGRSVKQTAFAVGYRQPSAFVEMFRRTMGATPRAWAASLVDQPAGANSRIVMPGGGSAASR